MQAPLLTFRGSLSGRYYSLVSNEGIRQMRGLLPQLEFAECIEALRIQSDKVIGGNGLEYQESNLGFEDNHAVMILTLLLN